MNGIFDSAWREFERLQVPDDAGPDARLLVRRAFYAGAYCFRDITARCGDLAPADAQVQAMGLQQELEVFAATVHTELEGKV